MIVGYLDVDGTGRAFRPFKTNSPLIVDANAVLALAGALECLEPVAADGSEVFEVRRRFQTVKSDFRLSGKAGEFLDVLASREALGLIVSIADDHEMQR